MDLYKFKIVSFFRRIVFKITLVTLTFSGNLCLNYLANKPSELYLTQNLTRLLVKVVKLAWFESVGGEFPFRKTIGDAQLLLKVNMPFGHTHQSFSQIIFQSVSISSKFNDLKNSCVLTPSLITSSGM